MNSHFQGGDENPLDDYAAKASQELTGRATDVSNSSVARVESGQVSLRESFVQVVQASAVHMENAVAGAVKTSALEAGELSVGVAVASSVRADTLQSGVLAAAEIEGSEIRTGLLFAVNVRGDVHSALSPLAGLAIGAGFAVTLFTLRLAARSVARRLASK